jgi:HEXXH motif-containing protein
LKRSGSDVVFLQQLDHYLPRLKRISQRFEECLACDSVWLDGMWANDGGSIGSHFDASDNFLVQISGTKRWRLAPPSFLTAEERNLRMANRPGVGGALMPASSEEYVLQPGDVLYLPLMWIHWGVSEGHTVSVSIVCNARCAATEFAPVLLEAISRDDEWCKPLVSSRTRGDALRWFERDARRLGLAAMNPSVREAFLRQLEKRSQDADNEALPSDDGSPEHLAALARIVARARGVPKAVDAASLAVFDQPAIELARLHELQYRRTLKTLLTALAHVAEADDLWSRTVARAALMLIASVENAVLKNWVRDPRIGAWGILASLTLKAKQHLRVWELMSFLAGHLVDLAASDGSASLSLCIELGDASEFSFRLSNCAAVVDLHAGRRSHSLLVSVSGGTVRIAGQHSGAVGKPRLQERTHLSGRLHVDSRLSVNVRPIELAGRRNLAVTTGDPWLTHCLDRLGVSGASKVTLASRSELAAFRSAVQDAMSLIAACWPRAASALEQIITEVSYLEETKYKANNETLELFRGLIRSGARHPFLLAQALIHEFAHNLLGSISDVCELFNRHGQEVVQSPFVHRPRNAEALLQAVMAFTWESELTRRMVRSGHSPPKGFPIRKYVSNLVASLHATVSLLREGRGLTPDGERVLDALDSCFKSLEPELLQLATKG